HRRAHRLGTLLELDADASAVHRMLVAVPGEAFDSHLRDIAAEAAVAVDEGGAGAGTRSGQRRGETARAAGDDENIGFQNDVDRAGGLSDLLHIGAFLRDRGTNDAPRQRGAAAIRM